MGSNGGELTGWDPYFTAFYVFAAVGFGFDWRSANWIWVSASRIEG
jgi:hypothetical protein